MENRTFHKKLKVGRAERKGIPKRLHHTKMSTPIQSILSLLNQNEDRHVTLSLPVRSGKRAIAHYLLSQNTHSMNHSSPVNGSNRPDLQG